MTTRGFGVAEARELAHLIADVFDAPQDEGVIAAVADKVKALCQRLPVYAPQI